MLCRVKEDGGTWDFSCVPLSPPFILYLSNLTFKYDRLLAVAETCTTALISL